VEAGFGRFCWYVRPCFRKQKAGVLSLVSCPLFDGSLCVHAAIYIYVCVCVAWNKSLQAVKKERGQKIVLPYICATALCMCRVRKSERA
jgi:hypothetical protein